MEIPVGEALSLPIQMVVTSRSPPLIARGVLSRFDGSAYEVRLEGACGDLRSGEIAVLDLDRVDAPLIQGRIASCDGGVAWIQGERSRAREPREFPRVVGDLDVRYRVAPAHADEEMLAAWMDAGRAPPGDQAWHRPARLVDWSAAGLGFEDAETCAEGDRLLMDLAAGDGGPRHRAVGRVIRVLALVTGGPATHRIAVDLEHLAPAGREYLLEQTILRQRLPGEAD